MARVRVKVAWPGEHHHRNGVTTVTPGRCRHWERQFAELAAAGVRVPVPWGHQTTALPADPLVTDSQAFANSKFNAGYLAALEPDPADGGTIATLEGEGLRVKNGKLCAVAELPDGRTVPTEIGEVSPAIGLDWTDGKGRTWRDIIAHVALTPFPVQAGQPGFEALSAEPPDGCVYLSAGAKPMPDPTKKPGEKDDEKDTPEPESADPDLAEDLTQPAEEDAGEEVPLDGQPAAGPEADRVSRIMATMAEFGVPLPPDTDPTNVLERLDSALLVAKAMKAQSAGQPQPQQQQPQRETPQPQQAPAVMMSTLPPTVQKHYREEFKKQRADRLDKIEALKKRGLPVTTANRLQAEVTAVKLSLDADGEIRPPAVDAVLQALDESLPGAGDPQTLLSAATPVTSPADGGDAGAAEAYPEYGNDLPMTARQKADVERRVAAVTGRTPK